jgi:nucleotide-binding universal stress UspA family protein
MNIVYATDGSDCARAAGRLLASLPLPADGRVTILSVLSGYDWVEPSLFAEWAQNGEQLAQRDAEESAAPLQDRRVPQTVRVRRGSAAGEILAQAEEDRADLIVVGSHGKGAMERFLTGSVSERVARYAHTSVLVARGEKVARVVIGVDGSESSEAALDALTRLPLPADAKCTVVHVIPAGALAPPVSLVPSQEYETLVDKYESERRTLAEQTVNRAEQRLRAAGRSIETEIRYGTPEEQLIATAHEHGADLIVTGSANRSPLGRLFLGSVAARVLGHAPCSVLVARGGDAGLNGT